MNLTYLKEGLSLAVQKQQFCKKAYELLEMHMHRIVKASLQYDARILSPWMTTIIKM